MMNPIYVSSLVSTLALSLTLASQAAAEQADFAAASPVAGSRDEAKLIAVLSGDSPSADKAIACKLLAINGSSKAVPELAKLLPNEKLASWSRIALEAIAGPQSAGALRQAAQQLSGKLQVGAINSLGVLKDPQAATLLGELLHAPDDQVASAAAVALGHIGGPQAADALLARLEAAPADVQSAIAEGCLLSAEQMVDQGQLAEAVELYTAVRSSQSPKQRILEAIRGEILARGPEGVPLLIEQFQAADIDRFRLALTTARELPGSELDQSMADELTRLDPERSALLIRVLADRTQGNNLPIILQSAQQGPPKVRAAAIEAIAEVGDESCLPVLLEIVATNESGLANLAEETIANLPGNGVDPKLLALLVNAEDDQLLLLINTIGRRGIQATDAIRKQLNHPNRKVRVAALSALGQTIEGDDLPLLISHVVDPQHAEDQPFAEQALLAASIRMPDREACSAELSTACVRAASTEAKVALLDILGQVGGENALNTIALAARSANPALVDAATRLLGKWMTVDAGPILIDLASNLPEGKYQVRSLRGYLRIAKQLRMNDSQRTEMCRQALAVATRPEEQQLVLEVLTIHPSKQGLQLANEAAKLPGLDEAAAKAADSISQSLSKSGR